MMGLSSLGFLLSGVLVDQHLDIAVGINAPVHIFKLCMHTEILKIDPACGTQSLQKHQDFPVGLCRRGSALARRSIGWSGKVRLSRAPGVLTSGWLNFEGSKVSHNGFTLQTENILVLRAGTDIASIMYPTTHL